MNRTFQVTFILRHDKKDSNGLVPIYLRFTVDGSKSEISVKRKINPSHWNVKKNDSKPLNEELNQLSIYLNSQKNAVFDAYSKLVISKQAITIKKLRDKLLQVGDQNDSLIKLATNHNNEFESLVGIKYSYGSYKNYKTTLLFLKDFLRVVYKRQDLNLADLNYQFADKYFKYLVTKKTCKHNGAIKHIQRLKKILNYGIRIGVIDKNPFISFQLSFKPYSRPILTWEQIMKLKTAELPSIALENVRDVFLFQCFTGLAYIDVQQVPKANQ